MTPSKKTWGRKKANGITPVSIAVSKSRSVQRAQEAWEAGRAVAEISTLRRLTVPDGIFTISTGTQDSNPHAVGHSKKRLSSPENSEDDQQRKRRAVEGRLLQGDRLTFGIPKGQQHAPLAKGVSPVPLPILRAVRSGPHTALPFSKRGAKPKEAVVQEFDIAPSGRPYKVYEGSIVPLIISRTRIAHR